MTRYGCVDDQKAAGFAVTTACEAAGVSTSGYYDWCQRELTGPTDRHVAEADLFELMREIFVAADGNYGVARMHKALRHGGLVINRKRVARLMARHAMAGRFRRRRCRTTLLGPDGYTIPDRGGLAVGRVGPRPRLAPVVGLLDGRPLMPLWRVATAMRFWQRQSMLLIDTDFAAKPTAMPRSMSRRLH